MWCLFIAADVLVGCSDRENSKREVKHMCFNAREARDLVGCNILQPRLYPIVHCTLPEARLRRRLLRKFTARRQIPINSQNKHDDLG